MYSTCALTYRTLPEGMGKSTEARRLPDPLGSLIHREPGPANLRALLDRSGDLPRHLFIMPRPVLLQIVPHGTIYFDRQPVFSDQLCVVRPFAKLLAHEPAPCVTQQSPLGSPRLFNPLSRAALYPFQFLIERLRLHRLDFGRSRSRKRMPRISIHREQIRVQRAAHIASLRRGAAVLASSARALPPLYWDCRECVAGDPVRGVAV